jgi:hypothetical protein
MENQLPAVNTNQLDEVLKNSGLAIIEGEEIKGSYLPFLNQLAEIHSQSVKINFENPTALDEEIAGKLRKATVKVRTGAEALKDDRNRMNLLKQKLEVASFKLIEASCKLTEEVFVNVEKAREIAEKKRKAELKVIRDAEAQQYSEFIPFGIDLGNLDETGYLNLLNGAKLQYNAKIESEKKAEAESIENLRLDKQETERRIEAGQFRDYLPNNVDFRNMAQEDYDTLFCQAQEDKKKHEAEQERVRLDNERLRKENEAKEKQRLFELAEAEKLRLKAELKAKQEREAAEEKARIEREKSAEIQRKQQIEIQRQKNELETREGESLRLKMAEEKRIADELKAKKEVELKLAKAPDKQKLIAMINSVSLTIPELKQVESIAVANVINEKFQSFKRWAESQISAI